EGDEPEHRDDGEHDGEGAVPLGGCGTSGFACLARGRLSHEASIGITNPPRVADASREATDAQPVRPRLVECRRSPILCRPTATPTTPTSSGCTCSSPTSSCSPTSPSPT